MCVSIGNASKDVTSFVARRLKETKNPYNNQTFKHRFQLRVAGEIKCPLKTPISRACDVTAFTQKYCDMYTRSFLNLKVLSFDCPQPISVRYVTIELAASYDPLQVCEVAVFAAKQQLKLPG